MTMEADRFMQRAIELSERAVRQKSGGPFGAVIVKDGEIVGEGCNQVTSRNDPSAHAEIVAIRSACQKLRTFRLSGCTIYASTEPCPMCLGAIYWARLDRLVYANSRFEASAVGFDDTFFHEEIVKPEDLRALQTTRMASGEALAVLRAWFELDGRESY